jgi:hypothetical protein
LIPPNHLDPSPDLQSPSSPTLPPSSSSASQPPIDPDILLSLSASLTKFAEFSGLTTLMTTQDYVAVDQDAPVSGTLSVPDIIKSVKTTFLHTCAAENPMKDHVPDPEETSSEDDVHFELIPHMEAEEAHRVICNYFSQRGASRRMSQSLISISTEIETMKRKTSVQPPIWSKFAFAHQASK